MVDVEVYSSGRLFFSGKGRGYFESGCILVKGVDSEPVYAYKLRPGEYVKCTYHLATAAQTFRVDE